MKYPHEKNALGIPAISNICSYLCTFRNLSYTHQWSSYRPISTIHWLNHVINGINHVNLLNIKPLLLVQLIPHIFLWSCNYGRLGTINGFENWLFLRDSSWLFHKWGYKLPSGKLTQLWKITIFHGYIHYFCGHFQ